MIEGIIWNRNTFQNQRKTSRIESARNGPKRKGGMEGGRKERRKLVGRKRNNQPRHGILNGKEIS